MSDFGSQLRRLRLECALPQREVADLLGVARSTLANLESGRERPSPRVWAALSEQFPDWVTTLERSYELERGHVCHPTGGLPTDREDQVDVPGPTAAGPLLGGPFVMERLTYVYVFGHSKAPEEILEVRRVRATRNGADGFGLALTQTVSGDFEVDERPLWGGSLETRAITHGAGKTVYLRRFTFDRVLRRGQVHEFATRSWIERDPDPSTAVAFSLTVPAQMVAIHLHFQGPQQPAGVARYGPLADESLSPEHHPEQLDRMLEPLPDTGSVAAYFDAPELGATYGVAWKW